MDGSLSTCQVAPIERLSPDAVTALHEASLEILEDIGIKVDLEAGLDLLADHGCTVDRETRLVTFPPDLVEEAVSEAPETVTLHARNPDNTVTIGEGDPVLSPCGSAPNVLTHDGGRRPSQLADYETLVKLTQAKDAMTCSGYNHCEPNDVDQAVKHFELMKRTILLTDKPLKGESWGADRSQAAIDMAGIANDDPDLSEPYVIATINTVSPRTLDTKMTGGLLTYAEHGQPTMVSPAVMAAASGPATLAGTLSQGNAEVLAGVTLAQLANPGTPVLYGLPTSNVDVRYGSFSIGGPEGALCVTAAAQMARFYGLPCRAGGGLTDAKTVGDQSGAEAMFQLLVSVLSGVDFIHHSAGIMDSYSTSSPEKFVLDCDRIEYITRFQAGFEITEETLAKDLIADVDPGGHFLNQRHTLEHSKDFHIPELFYRDAYDNWTDDGSKGPYERAHEHVGELLEAYERPPIDDDTEAALEAYVEEHVDASLAGS